MSADTTATKWRNEAISQAVSTAAIVLIEKQSMDATDAYELAREIMERVFNPPS